MIEPGQIGEIIETYQKHGWILRRVLLSPALKAKLGTGGDDIFNEVMIFDSDINAAWFSRPPKSGGIAWEIRYLGDPPFALLENIDESSPAFEDLLRSVETRLHESITAKISA